MLYVLDEPSIGLHQRDNGKLIATLKELRDLGNTLIVVEHDEDTMRAADWIVDIGPGAGVHGGEVVAQGTAEDIMAEPRSLTGQYLSGARKIPVPLKRRLGNGKFLTIRNARENNLKGIDVQIPLGLLTCVTGVSGSGKSSLINEVLYKTLAAVKNRAHVRPGRCDGIEGLENVDKVICIDQSPIGRTPRSNPATYTGVFNDIRELFSTTNDAKMRGYGPGRFSFNVKGGRCEACSGDGLIKIEMHFLPDVYVPCDVCKGKRYNRETLEVRYKGKNISEVLDMTAEEAAAFFENIPRIRDRIQTLCDVGLGYVKLGQSSTTLSGGEAQRVKLATELSKRSTGQTVYVLDEPTTGLHTADVQKLITILDRLADAGNTVVVIEHNLDVIKVADHIIDLGPEGGDGGGRIVFEGTPEGCADCAESATGEYLRKVLDNDRLHRKPAHRAGLGRVFRDAYRLHDTRHRAARGHTPGRRARPEPLRRHVGQYAGQHAARALHHSVHPPHLQVDDRRGASGWAASSRGSRPRPRASGTRCGKYQFFGLAVFVGIPLPGTGAWTGALIAAVMDMRLRSALPSILLGVVMAGLPRHRHHLRLHELLRLRHRTSPARIVWAWGCAHARGTYSARRPLPRWSAARAGRCAG